MAGAQLILLVDDEKDMLDLMQFNLRQAGFDTSTARDGEQALALVAQRLPDLVLLDLMLPGVPGTEVCRQLKSASRTKHVPVIMVTARGEEVDRVVGFELGADDFVTKPFSMRELVLRVRAVLRRGTHGEVDVVGHATNGKNNTLEASRLIFDTTIDVALDVRGNQGQPFPRAPHQVQVNLGLTATHLPSSRISRPEDGWPQAP